MDIYEPIAKLILKKNEQKADRAYTMFMSYCGHNHDINSSCILWRHRDIGSQGRFRKRLHVDFELNTIYKVSVRWNFLIVLKQYTTNSEKVLLLLH